MDDLFREILAASPALSPSSLPACAPTLPAERAPARSIALSPQHGWSDEADMRRLLDMLPDVQGVPELDLNLDLNLEGDQNAGIDFPSALDLNLEFGAWEPSSVAPVGSAVGVY